MVGSKDRRVLRPSSQRPVGCIHLVPVPIKQAEPRAIEPSDSARMMLTKLVMDHIALYLCLPWMLLLNFALFQYLTVTYFKRRRELRVALLIGCAFLSFFSLTGFAYPSAKFVANMNNVSGICSVLTFLLQITIICRDVTKRVKVWSLRWMMYAAETLVVLEIGLVVFNIVESCFPDHGLAMITMVDTIAQNASLLFIFFFRFHYSSLSSKGGLRQLWASRKTEIVLYALLVTHEYPFELLDHATGLSWRYIQGLYMRVLIIGCLALTLSEKIRSSNTRRASNESTGASKKHHPQIMPSPHISSILHAKTTASTVTPSRVSVRC